MEERPEIRIKFEIGDIKFEAEGSASLVERERVFFTDNILPSAIDAIVRTRNTLVSDPANYMSTPIAPLVDGPNSVVPVDNTVAALSTSDWSRTSLASFAKSKGAIEHYDFIICAAYFNEKKNHIEVFSSSSLKELYSDAKKPEPSNISMSLSELVKKGLIMENPNNKGATPKEYILTADGESTVENMKPKDTISHTKQQKARKMRPKEMSKYSDLNCDELNLKSYPEIKELSTFKEKMLLAMYIITNAGKGEWFTVDDILYILTDILGEPATEAQIQGVFRREKRWFKTEKDNNNKLVHRKLLNEGKEFAESLRIKNEL